MFHRVLILSLLTVLTNGVVWGQTQAATMPNVVDMGWEKAIAVLRAAGFEVTATKNLGRAPSEDKAGKVVYQVPAAGAPARNDRKAGVEWYGAYEGGNSGGSNAGASTNNGSTATTANNSAGDVGLIGEWSGTALVFTESGGMGDITGETRLPPHKVPVNLKISRNQDGRWSLFLSFPVVAGERNRTPIGSANGMVVVNNGIQQFVYEIPVPGRAAVPAGVMLSRNGNNLSGQTFGRNYVPSPNGMDTFQVVKVR